MIRSKTRSTSRSSRSSMRPNERWTSRSAALYEAPTVCGASAPVSSRGAGSPLGRRSPSKTAEALAVPRIPAAVRRTGAFSRRVPTRDSVRPPPQSAQKHRSNAGSCSFADVKTDLRPKYTSSGSWRSSWSSAWPAARDSSTVQGTPSSRSARARRTVHSGERSRGSGAERPVTGGTRGSATYSARAASRISPRPFSEIAAISCRSLSRQPSVECRASSSSRSMPRDSSASAQSRVSATPGVL